MHTHHIKFIIRECIAISQSGVVFNAETGDSFAFNETALEILDGIKKGQLKEEIKLRILSKYSNTDDRMFETDYFDFISTLLSFRIIEKTA